MIKNSSLIPPDNLLYKYLCEEDVAVITNLLEIERKTEGILSTFIFITYVILAYPHIFKWESNHNN